MSKVLIIDDEEFILKLLQRFFTKLGLEHVSCSNPDELDRVLDEGLSDYGICFVDFHFFNRSAKEIVKIIKSQNDQIECVIMSGDPSKLRELQTTGVVCSTLSKPFYLSDLQTIMKRKGMIK